MSQVRPQPQLVPRARRERQEPSLDQLAWAALQDLQELKALQALRVLLEPRSPVRPGLQLRDQQEAVPPV